MNTDDVNMPLYRHRQHTRSPSLLLLTLSNNKDTHYYNRPSYEYRCDQQKTRHIPRMVGLHFNNLDTHDQSQSSHGWQRYSDKMGQLNPAPDIVYRNTYLEEQKQQQKLDINNKNVRCRSSSPHLKSSNSFSYVPSELSQQKQQHHQHRTIYDSILHSIRQIEQQRNTRHQSFYSRIQRPQNEDHILKRVLAERKLSAKPSLSRVSSTKTIRATSPLFNHDLRSPETFVNYIHYSRVLHSGTPNQFSETPQSVLSQI